jgi:SRSO17 transposase
LQKGNWRTEELRQTRLRLIRRWIGEQEMILCLDETGDVKKGNTTDYVARQYIGNLGKTERGIVSVNAYGLVEGITYPLLFKIYKPKGCLQPGDVYQTKPKLALSILQELVTWGFRIKLVLADSLYGERGDIIRYLQKLGLPFIVAIRSNHPVLLPQGQRVRYNRWKAYQQQLSHRQPELRYIREIIFGQRRSLRYYQITKGETPDPTGENSWYIMTNLEGNVQRELAQLDSLRTWIEYGFKQVKNELGWADYRLTDYARIERWWEIIFSTYLLVSIQAQNFQSWAEDETPSAPSGLTFPPQLLTHFPQHPWWEEGGTWKSALNNIRLVIQPYLFYNLLGPWLEIFQIPGFRRSFLKLLNLMNDFRTPFSPSIFPNFLVA